MQKIKLSKEALMSLDQAVAARRPEAFAMLRNMLGSPDHDMFLRAAAVSYLGAIPSEASERLLVSVLAKDKSEMVRAKACSALFQVGSERSLDALASVASKGSESLRTIAGFAHVVISHRLHQPSRFLKHPERKDLAMPTGLASAFQSHALTDVRRRELLADLETSRLKLGNYASTPIGISCGRTTWALAVHDVLAAEGLSGPLRQRPSVLGVVARWSEEHQRWSVARLILGGPLKGYEFYVSIHRRDGVLDLAGTGNLSERTLDLISARRPGAVPLSARVYWHGGAIVIAGISALERLPAQMPEALPTVESTVRESPAQ